MTGAGRAETPPTPWTDSSRGGGARQVQRRGRGRLRPPRTFLRASPDRAATIGSARGRGVSRRLLARAPGRVRFVVVHLRRRVVFGF